MPHRIKKTKNKTGGVMLRSRCRYKELGEKIIWIFFELRKLKFYGQK